jgi:hypothetical protein
MPHPPPLSAPSPKGEGKTTLDWFISYLGVNGGMDFAIFNLLQH